MCEHYFFNDFTDVFRGGTYFMNICDFVFYDFILGLIFKSFVNFCLKY